MSKQNSELFLQSFHRIEQHLRRIANRRRGKQFFRKNFYQLVDDIAVFDAITQRYGNDLKEFADLRNAIVHERQGDRVIAEPNDLAVAWIQRIEKLLIEPPKVLPRFGVPVTTAQVSDSVIGTARIMRERDHSQVPVFAKKDFRGLLTGNTIVRWLGSLTDAQCADVAATTVGEVLNSSEPPDNFIFIGKNAAIVEAEDMLLKGIQDRREIDALLITENGSMNEPLLGIMTTWDIATSGELTRPGY